MTPRQPTESLQNSAAEDLLSPSMKATVILSATSAGSGRSAAPQETCDWFEDNPPTTEHEILSAVLATQHEISTAKLGTVGVMNLIARQAQHLTDAGGAVVELLDGTELVYRAASGRAAKSLGLRVDSRKSLSGLCFHTEEVMRCDDSEKDDRVDKSACRWVGIRSMALAPLAHEERAVGVLAVISPTVSAFGERDVWTLRLMANLLAEALAEALAVDGKVGSESRLAC
jgi:GAF domain-containing protein